VHVSTSYLVKDVDLLLNYGVGGVEHSFDAALSARIRLLTSWCFDLRGA